MLGGEVNFCPNYPRCSISVTHKDITVHKLWLPWQSSQGRVLPFLTGVNRVKFTRVPCNRTTFLEYVAWYGMMWYMIWYMIYYICVMVWCDMVYDMMWYDIRYMIWYGMLCDMIYDMWYDMVCYDAIWYDMMWYIICDMIWYVKIWCDMVYDVFYDIRYMWYDICYGMLYDMILIWCDMIWNIFVNCNWVHTRWQ
jgi:hypothetical protein